MNRSDMYLKQLHGLQAWLRAQGDEEGADQADDLAEHLSRNHEAVDDQTTPAWAHGEDDEVDVEPDIRCSPAAGCIFENRAGELILTIDMLDGGDVAVVHMGDVVRWVERRGAPAVRPTTVSGEIADDGEVIDAEFEVTDDDPFAEIAGEETAAAADDASDRDIEAELDAQDEDDAP